MFCNVILKFPSTSNIHEIQFHTNCINTHLYINGNVMCGKFVSQVFLFDFFYYTQSNKISQREKNAEKVHSTRKNENFVHVFLSIFPFYFSFSCGEQSFVSTSFVHHHQKPSANFSSYFSFLPSFYIFFFLCMILYE